MFLLCRYLKSEGFFSTSLSPYLIPRTLACAFVTKLPAAASLLCGAAFSVLFSDI